MEKFQIGSKWSYANKINRSLTVIEKPKGWEPWTEEEMIYVRTEANIPVGIPKKQFTKDLSKGKLIQL